jgi:hypothetical protein
MHLVAKFICMVQGEAGYRKKENEGEADHRQIDVQPA